MLGWTPTQIFTPREGGGWTVTTESEWDYTERNIAVALDEIDRQTCGGCGGDLTVELTDKPPYEDDGDGHFHRFTPLWCRRCVSQERNRRALEAREKELLDGPADPFPAARRFAIERLPIPTTD